MNLKKLAKLIGVKDQQIQQIIKEYSGAQKKPKRPNRKSAFMDYWTEPYLHNDIDYQFEVNWDPDSKEYDVVRTENGRPREIVGHFIELEEAKEFADASIDKLIQSKSNRFSRSFKLDVSKGIHAEEYNRPNRVISDPEVERLIEDYVNNYEGGFAYDRVPKDFKASEDVLREIIRTYLPSGFSWSYFVTAAGRFVRWVYENQYALRGESYTYAPLGPSGTEWINSDGRVIRQDFLTLLVMFVMPNSTEGLREGIEVLVEGYQRQETEGYLRLIVDQNGAQREEVSEAKERGKKPVDKRGATICIRNTKNPDDLSIVGKRVIKSGPKVYNLWGKKEGESA